MTVGDTEADPLFEVTGIAITDSHVVIAQESEGTLRFYDRDGSLERRSGGGARAPVSTATSTGCGASATISSPMIATGVKS